MTTPNQQKNKSKAPKGYEADFKHLIKQYSEIVSLKKEESILYQANFSYYERWLRNNEKTIKGYFADRKKIDMEIFEYDNIDGVITFKVIEQDGKKINVFKEGISQEDLEKAVGGLLQQKITVVP